MHPIHRRRRLVERIKHAVGATLAIIVALLLVVYGVSRTGLFELPNLFGDNGSGSGSSAAGSDTYTPLLTIDSPFEGTPTADWGDFDSLVFPDAAATKHFSAEQVGDALDAAREVLKKGRFDWPMGDHDEDRYVKLFAEAVRDDVRDDLGDEHRLSYVTALAEGRSLVADPRVKGEVEVDETSSANGVRGIVVRVKAVWAYAFDGSVLSYGDNLLVLNEHVELHFYTGDRIRPQDRGLRPGGSQMWAQNMECDPFDDGYLSAYRNDPSQAGTGTNTDPDKIYDPNADFSHDRGSCPEK